MSDASDSARAWHELLQLVRRAEHQRDDLVRLVLRHHAEAHGRPARWCHPACQLASEVQC